LSTPTPSAPQVARPETPAPETKSAARPLLRQALGGLLAVALLALAAGVYLTRGGDPALEYNAPPPQLPNTAGLVDQSPLSTARALAAQAATRQEQEYARQALELSDREVDQAFAAALHEATASPPPLKGPALKAAQRLAALSPQIAAEQQQVAALAKAAGADQLGAAAVQQQLAEAQLALDEDERDDLQQDLVRLGGDRRSRIQQALDEHEALQKQSSSLPQNTAAAALESSASLRTVEGKLAAFGSLEQRHRLLQQARTDAAKLEALLSRKHELLENATSAGILTHAPAAAPVAAAGPGTAGKAAPSQAGAALHAAAPPPGENGLPTILELRALADQRKTLAQLDQRIHESQQLAEVYAAWDKQVLLDRRTVLHRLIVLAAFVVVLLGLMFAAHLAVVGQLDRRIADRRRRNHLRVIVETGVQGAGGLLILLALFGPPQQVSAILGLATAGIAFVMKDFVVAFFGWFVLMGRGGLRVGDLVEIQGVGGEVVEIGLMRTVLLETASGVDVGHPTGRRVAFMNSYAIEGRFFNYSTAGQWVWDELVVNIPVAEEAASKAEAIREVVEEDTRPDAEIAEREWRQLKIGSSPHSAAPAMSLRPAAVGIDVIVHYVTRASERYQTRTRLYSRAIEILHFSGKPQEPVSREV
jgi:small-conductance mechanosensitive channel